MLMIHTGSLTGYSVMLINVNLIYGGHALIHATETKETNISNERNVVKNPN